jgi:Spy/CpxP family protein refolding chaperone
MKRILLAVLVAAGALMSASSFAATAAHVDGQTTLNDTFQYPSY